MSDEPLPEAVLGSPVSRAERCEDPEHSLLDLLVTKHLRKQLASREVAILSKSNPSAEEIAVYRVLRQIHNDALREFDPELFSEEMER